MKNKVLVIDDDTDICLLLQRFLTKNNFEVAIATTGKAAIEKIPEFEPQVVLTDFRLGDIDGIEMLIKIKEYNAAIAVIIITGYSDIRMAVKAMKYGAYDYITKPLFPDEILATINKALETKQPLPMETHKPGDKKGKSIAAKASTSKISNGNIFGNSEQSHHILKQVSIVAPTNFSVIIYGESGSGKEAIAHEIHNQSLRKNGPFVAMDCGALSKELSGSELFGHEKGSFTGAINQKIGHFELADGGTLFLDEVANLTYEIQMSLLRVIQERKVKRIGGNKDIPVDVRILVASNEKLWNLSQEGNFREDLYHRFNEFTIDVPALRDRKEDIITYAYFFLEHTNSELNKEVKTISAEVISLLQKYNWPGNLRELKNVIKRAVLLSTEDTLQTTTLPFEILNYSKLSVMNEESEQSNIQGNSALNQENNLSSNLKNAASQAEQDIILQALKKANFNKSKAAQILNIDRKTLYNKMKNFNLE